jgi:hypothetical protein
VITLLVVVVEVDQDPNIRVGVEGLEGVSDLELARIRKVRT